MDWTQDDGDSPTPGTTAPVRRRWRQVASGKWQVEIHHAGALVTFLNMTML